MSFGVGPAAHAAPTVVAPPPSVELVDLGGGRVRATFSMQPERAESAVFLAGDFNGWKPDATRMERMGDGFCRASVELAHGRHTYKFVVDGRWIADPRNPEREPDGHDGFNSLLVIGGEPAFDASLARKGDGAIEFAACRHDPSRAMWLQREPDGATLVRYRALAGDVESVALVLDGTPPQPMGHVTRVGSFDWWQIRIPRGHEDTPYGFVVTDGATNWTDPSAFRVPGAGAAAPLRTPEWARDAVWYQIMLDRFANGDRGNDPPNTRPWTSRWRATSPWETENGQTFWEWAVFNRHYGGDLEGLRARIPYLKSLGVNAIYLNPVFEAPSHHKYDATNFVHIDDNFGSLGDAEMSAANEDLLDASTWGLNSSDRLFLEVLRELKANGFRVIVDGVFNHVGERHVAFADVRARGKESPFAGWFDIESFEPFAYRGWAGFGQLPAFRKSADGLESDTLVRHIMDVTRRWMDPNGDGDPSDGVDGWRLDVPNEVPMGFWRAWRATVKSVNPDAYIVGEIWKRADDWLDGTTFDAVMNYPFAQAVVQWVSGEIKPAELDARLAELRLAYSEQATAVLQNLLGSHDTDRLVSMIANPGRGYDRANSERPGSRYDGARPSAETYRRARLAALVQMTYVGAPMIWYGDEAGMFGSDDPFCRKPMVWRDVGAFEDPDERFDEEHFDAYRAMVALRGGFPALRRGSMRTLVADDARNLWVFERALGGQRVVVALNASAETQEFTLPDAEWRGYDWRTVLDTDGAREVDRLGVVGPLGGRVLLGTKRP
ncbi:MAG: alpha-glucosidase C-terminal domain-containing protein [Planctomycetaceae bacterium]|nr:alpha-glucosidase C-terminal domain-containing protein [Planctomycetaceae bacterium]